MPQPAKPLCPAAAVAPIPAEPLAPSGVSASGLSTWLHQTFGAQGDAFYQWMAVDHPVWGRSLAARAEAVQGACMAAEAAK